MIHLELIIKGMFYNLRVDLSGGTVCTAVIQLVPKMLSIASICILNCLVLSRFPDLHVIHLMSMTEAGEGR